MPVGRAVVCRYVQATTELQMVYKDPCIVSPLSEVLMGSQNPQVSPLAMSYMGHSLLGDQCVRTIVYRVATPAPVCAMV